MDETALREVDPIVFGHRVRHFRRRQGLTLAELGERVGRPAPYLSLVENGRREPRLGQIAALAAALGVSVADLLDPEPPSRRARLEMELERAQQHPRYHELGLPYLKATSRLPDEAMEHILTLFEQLVRRSELENPDAGEVRRANGQVTRWLRERDGYLEEVERVASRFLDVCGYEGTGALTSRHLADLVAALGYRIRLVEDIPRGARSVVDRHRRLIYVPQRNELRTRQARKAVLQTAARVALAHPEPRTVLELLRQRVETAYFAAAVLVPERAAVPFLRDARAGRDLSAEDVKERFYVSYEMAAQRLTNLATRHLGLATHLVRSDGEGVVWKAYANDGVPLPADDAGGSEGQVLCSMWGARTAFASPDRFDIHYQFTDTPAGSYWCATHLSVDPERHAFTFGVRFEDARFFRGRDTDARRLSACPAPSCCRQPQALDGIEVTSRMQHRLHSVLVRDLAPPVDPAELHAFVARHVADEGSQTANAE